MEISFGITGYWFLGYLLFVWLTPANFDLIIFTVPLMVCAGIETIEGLLKIKAKKR